MKPNSNDELLIPVEKLREFAVWMNDPMRDSELVRHIIGREARKALMEKGLQDSKYEGEGNIVSVFSLIHEYLSDKDFLKPEEHQHLAVALRDLGRTAYQNPKTIGDDVVSLHVSLCPEFRQRAFKRSLDEHGYAILRSEEMEFDENGHNLALKIAIPNAFSSDGVLDRRLERSAISEIRKLEEKAQTAKFTREK